MVDNLNEPSLIIMDNAKYHCVYRPEVPQYNKMLKRELQDYLKKKNVTFDKSDTVGILKTKAKKYIEDNEVWEVVYYANSRGHKVVWTPPGYSNLQPIELLWARLKGNVGCQYEDGTTLRLVHNRLLCKVERMNTEEGKDYINRIIEKCYKKSYNIWQQINSDEANKQALADNAAEEQNEEENVKPSSKSSAHNKSNASSSTSDESQGSIHAL
jgi:transposase